MRPRLPLIQLSSQIRCRFQRRTRYSLASSVLIAITILFLCSGNAFAAVSSPPAPEACPRPAVGSTVEPPPELGSRNGVLEVTLHFKYQVTYAGQGPPRYCYVTDDGLESPTLRVHPGDQLIIHLHNDLPASTAHSAMKDSAADARENGCQGMAMNSSITNLHFHGLTVPPTCHQDEVIRTAVPAGTDFDYRMTIPRDEPPGLYWYHPHPHGFSERQVQGGASGALIVEGLDNVNRSLASLPERVIVLRDQPLTNLRFTNNETPAWDISINYVPVAYPDYRPAVIETRPSRRELWRVLNAGANTLFNLQVQVKGVAQPIEVVAIDGVPVPKGAPESRPVTGVPLPPGARMEFVVETPAAGEAAQFVTTAWDTGIEGDRDPARPIANIVSREDAPEPAMPAKEAAVAWRFPRLTREDFQPHVQRLIYFSQYSPNPGEGDTSVFYFVTVAGQTPKVYEMGQAPNIVLHQGDVEDWTVENRSQEDHVFHIHQIHFRVLEVDGKPVNDPTLRDTYDLPHWNGTGAFPSIKVRMDFRDPNTVGTFLYHCHILKHEDMGMMGVIQVLPPGLSTQMFIDGPHSVVQPAAEIKFIATLKAERSGQAPSGTVQFLVDGIPSGRAVPLKDGQAEFTTSFDSSGPHQILASYSGDEVHDESISAPMTVKVASF